MKAIVTVIGKDKVGIIAKVSAKLTELHFNIEDISQTILQDYFVMLMMVEARTDCDFGAVSAALGALGKEAGVDVRIQHEDIFSAMHRI